MKTISKKQIEKNVAKIFGGFPKATKVYATSDGNVFLDENRAQLHAGKQGTVYPYDRPIDEPSEDAPPVDSKPITATEAIKAIEAAESLEQIEQFRGDGRKTVVSAFEKKRAELSKKAGKSDNEEEE